MPRHPGWTAVKLVKVCYEDVAVLFSGGNFDSNGAKVTHFLIIIFSDLILAFRILH